MKHYTGTRTCTRNIENTEDPTDDEHENGHSPHQAPMTQPPEEPGPGSLADIHLRIVCMSAASTSTVSCLPCPTSDDASGRFPETLQATVYSLI